VSRRRLDPRYREPVARRILITGMSGTGKSTALDALEDRGFRVVDTDEPGWKVQVGDEWVWDEARIDQLLRSDDAGPLFVSGCVANQGRFYSRFDAVVLLSAPADVILERITSRTTNGYGKTAREREAVLRDLDQVEPRLRATSSHEVDATRPRDEIVATLIAIGGG
jgi:dephospho-CoA kinase